jgi:uncharacterized protein YciI
MLHIVQLTDKPNQQELREKLMDSHLKWIEENRDWVLMAGSMRSAPGQPAQGGLWIVEATDKNDVMEKLASDPFYASGIRAKVAVFYWGLASDDMRLTPDFMKRLRTKTEPTP